jgi:hypothetical protein
MTLAVKTPTPARLERWNALGDELYSAQRSLQQAQILTGRMHGKQSWEVRRLETLIVALDRERTRQETVAASEGFFDSPRMSPIRGAQRRAELREGGAS